MGILDDVAESINRAGEAASRGARKLRLQAQIGDVNKRRIDLSAQLGASLYAETKDKAEFTTGREAIYDGIAECDEARKKLQEEIAAIEQEANEAAAPSATALTCSRCGVTVKADDLVCPACGKPVQEMLDELDAVYEQESATDDATVIEAQVEDVPVEEGPKEPQA